MTTLTTPLGRDTRTASFKLATINPGDVVEVETTSGSTWTFVRTSLSLLQGRFMTSMVMMTTSNAAGQIFRDWRSICPQNEIKIGEPIKFDNWIAPSGRAVHTGSVAKVCLNGRRVL